MSLTKRAQAILKALTELGNSAAEMAESLKKHSVTGTPEESTSCAIANYMKTKFKCEDVEVDGCTVRVGDHDVDMTKASKEFIEKFDEYEYPDLLDAESKETWEETRHREDDESCKCSDCDYGY